MIREATPDDLLDLLIIGREFYKESGVELSFDKNILASNLEKAMDNPSSTVLVLEEDKEIVGGVVLAKSQVLFSTDVFAVVLLLYLSKDHRSLSNINRMMKAITKWSNDKNCKYLSASFVEGYRDLTPLYRRYGFKSVERNFIKEL